MRIHSCQGGKWHRQVNGRKLTPRDMEIDQPRKRGEPTFAERLLPTVAPATNGTGFVVGVASSI